MRTRPAALLAVALAAVSLAPAAFAAGGVSVAGVDTSGYPDVRVTVVVPLGSPQPRLTENGRPVAGLRGTNLGRAKSVVLAVDRSQSMKGTALADATAAARAFVAAKGPADRIEVIAFGRQAIPLTRFSTSAADADSALTGLATDAQEGTALWDAVVRAAGVLRRQAGPGRVIVVVTDGSDVSSTATQARAIAAAHRAHAAVYAIGIEGPGFSPAPLQELAAETGGAFRAAASSAQLRSLYDSIGNELARSWQLGYVTAARPGDPIRLAAAVPWASSAVRTVHLPEVGVGAPPSPQAPFLSRSAWTSPLGPVVLAGAVGLLVLLAFLFALGSRSGSWLNARLAPHLGPAARRGKRRRPSGGRLGLRGLLATTESALERVRSFQSLQRLITRADLPLLAAELLYACLGVALVVALVAVLAGAPGPLVLLLMLATGSLPVLWVGFKARARIKAFDNQLPDLLITIAASLKAGHSFRHAIQAVVDEGAEPAAKEFRRVLTETRLGRPMDEALGEMGERIGSANLTFVLTSVTIQRQIGGSLAGLFDMVAETVRQRQQFSRKIRSLTAMGRMSAYVLGGLPFAVGLLISVVSPTYMAPLWQTTVGHELVGGGFVMLAVGALFLRKIVSFKG